MDGGKLKMMHDLSACCMAHLWPNSETGLAKSIEVSGRSRDYLVRRVDWAGLLDEAVSSLGMLCMG